MNREEIEIAVLPDGRVEYTIKGIPGSACESISVLLEQLGVVEQETRTDDYYAQGADANLNINV